MLDSATTPMLQLLLRFQIAIWRARGVSAGYVL